ncbi:hypothetical protein [Nocardia vinacea]|uniref:hypothetical protein n=1 Tax=Nocardia vinacea TaxID=96468 RepID=UPI0002E30A3C|nr:hypothetical protein [Nocardia vinacea]
MLAVIAQAGLRNWAINLHRVLADQGVHVANVAINLLPAARAPEGYPHRDPDDIATLYWDLHTKRDQVELVINS